MTRLPALIFTTTLCTLGGAIGAAAQDLVITNARIIVGTGATIDSRQEPSALLPA